MISPGINSSPIPQPFREQYLEAQLSHDRQGALSIIDDVLNHGYSIPEIYLGLLKACQYELGRLWESNRITVAQEHIGTGISQLALSHLYSRITRQSPVGKTVLIACVEGELHDVGARMVADFCEMQGFDVIYLGADVPISALVAQVEESHPDIIGLSVTMTFNVPALYKAAEGLHTLNGYQRQAVAGGRGLSWLGNPAEILPIRVISGDSFEEVQSVTRMLAGVTDA